MFESTEYPKPLEEDRFEQWLEEGRQSKMRYEYMLVVWDELNQEYQPDYVPSRAELDKHPLWGRHSGHTATIAAYDLYSESRITLD